MKTYQIPNHVIVHPEGQHAPAVDADEIIYEPVTGEMVHVLLWVQYPDYDMIFGVPFKDSPRYEKETAFWCIRRNERQTHGHYLDVMEVEAMLNGFAKIQATSRTHSPHLWEKK